MGNASPGQIGLSGPRVSPGWRARETSIVHGPEVFEEIFELTESRLVDILAARGLDCLAVLDISGAALDRAQERLGARAVVPTWIEADVAGDWSLKAMDIWHDRAVFHFLTEPADRARYVQHLHQTLKPGGTAIVATFAMDGPERCSGLPVVRYDPDELALTLGRDLTLVETRRYVHTTPWGTTQSFQYCRLRRTD